MICAPFLGTEGGVERVLMVVGMRCGTKEDGCNLFSKGRDKMRLFFSFKDGMQLLSGLGVVAGMIISSISMSTSSYAGTVTFGAGANAFNMEFVTIGNPGNAADTSGFPNPAGSVAYTYAIGKYEVSEDMINKFNASQFLQITKDNRGLDKPATSVTWNEAARFVNWLNTSSGYSAAYKYTFMNNINVLANITTWSASDPGFDPSNPYRNSLAKYFLPSMNEWYKAAFYDPSLNGGTGGYWDYGTASNTVPTSVFSGTQQNTAVYGHSLQQGPANVYEAGGLSAYGVMALSGNVIEWEETSEDQTNSSGVLGRGYRGGGYRFDAQFLKNSVRGFLNAENGPDFVGFRVATITTFGGGGGGGGGGGEVPEPTSMAIFGLGALGMAYRARRKAKAKAKQA